MSARLLGRASLVLLLGANVYRAGRVPEIQGGPAVPRVEFGEVTRAPRYNQTRLYGYQLRYQFTCVSGGGGWAQAEAIADEVMAELRDRDMSITGWRLIQSHEAPGTNQPATDTAGKRYQAAIRFLELEVVL